MQSHFLTDVGQVRSHNEDSGGIFYNKSKQMICVVADGMGGHQAGDVASQMVTELLQKKWEKEEGLATPELVENWLKEAIEDANELVYKQSCENEDLQGMGTTLVTAVCADTFFSIAHVGDSRGYVLQNNVLKQVTEDHTLVNELVRSGEITESDAQYHPRKNVLLRALGTEQEVQFDLHTMEWDKDDLLLLCSDGLTNKIDDKELENSFNDKENIKDISEYLVALANERGGEDNITLLVVQSQSEWEAGDKA